MDPKNLLPLVDILLRDSKSMVEAMINLNETRQRHLRAILPRLNRKANRGDLESKEEMETLVRAREADATNLLAIASRLTAAMNEHAAAMKAAHDVLVFSLTPGDGSPTR